MTYPRYNDSNEIMISHEAEDYQPEPVQPIDPLPVVVRDAVTTVDIIPQHVSFRTFVLTTDNPYKQILTLDLLRVKATLVTLDHDVVLSSSRGQAMSPSNVVANFPTPDGAVLSWQAGFPVPVTLETVGEVWATANTYPSRVAVYLTRRTS